MLTVYGRDTSSNVQAVMWGIAELGLDCERLDYGFNFGRLDSAEFRAMTPHGRVPVLRDGDVVIWESCAILRYLAARYGSESNLGDAFWPGNPAARARVDMWAEWGKVSFALDFTMPIFWPKIRTSPKDRDEAALGAAIANFELRTDRLNGQLELHEFIVSDTFTLADIVVGHLLFRWFTMDIPRQPRPRLEAYYARLKSRPAFREHVMVSYEILRAEGA